jgi:steroid delta-isomerase-like uncharacterized protein
MSTETNKQIVRKLFENMDKGDSGTWQALLAPDFAAHVAGNDRAMTAQEFAGMAGMFATSFANGRHIIESQVAEGDRVETRLIWTALHVAQFNGVPASHKPVRIAAVSLDRFVDGKIAEHRALVDVMSLMTQIGAIPLAA